MTVTASGRKLALGGAVAIIGGVVALAGALLPWERIDPGLAASAGTVSMPLALSSTTASYSSSWRGSPSSPPPSGCLARAAGRHREPRDPTDRVRRRPIPLVGRDHRDLRPLNLKDIGSA